MTADRKDKQKYLEQIKEISSLAGELAHEIKNPLSTIKVNLKLVSEDIEEVNTSAGRQNSEKIGRAARKIAIIRKETDRLEQTLERFLQYINRPPPQLVQANINGIISDMIDFFGPQAISHSITIRQGLYPGPIICKVDPNMLKQVILNLFINAQQAMQNGGELIVRTTRREKTAIIQISDTGSGIGPEKLADIFNAGYSSGQKEWGLGLPTAGKIIEQHNGKITVTSEKGKGTSFTIELSAED